ncbi:hypothetical protein [Microvirgula aerodenitrificans]|uniref:hypothetical protein n=1 Tax=Microvirgula aerodenitrificans TaxID=57480 RepID=UPI00048CEE1D|nr:hypothetical protein [Microvirgula aerodenitrificans]
MKWFGAAFLLLILIGCSGEEAQNFKQPNWQRDAIVSAPGVAPRKVQQDVDAKGRKEVRHLYLPDGKPGFQIELDGDKRIEQIVIAFDQFRDAGTEQDNTAVKTMAKQTLAVLTGGDGREVDALIEAGKGDGGTAAKRREINGVEIVANTDDAMVIWTLQRPANAVADAEKSAGPADIPTLGISTATIKAAVDSYAEGYQHGTQKDGVPTLAIKLRPQARIELLGDSDDLTLVSVLIPAGGEEAIMLKNMARLLAVLKVACPEMQSKVTPAAWMQERLAETVTDGKGRKQFARVEEFGNKRVYYHAKITDKQIRVTVAHKDMPTSLVP